MYCRVVGAGWNLLEQYQKKQKDPTYEFSWEDLLRSSTIGGSIGLASGTVISLASSLAHDNFDNQSPIQKAAYLREVLKHRNGANFEVKLKGESVKKALAAEFGELIKGKPRNQGSIAKGTAIEGADFDITLDFRPNSFSTLDEMYHSVYDFLNCEFYDGDLVKVRKQKRSVGLVFDCCGEEILVEVAPVRTYKNGQNSTIIERVNNIFGQNSYRKTNTRKHHIKGPHAKSIKNIVKLIKIWKTEYKVPLKGFLLERLVIKAFHSFGTDLPNSIYNRLIDSLDWISNEIEFVSIKDPSNSNNILTDYLTPKLRREISNDIAHLISEVEENPRLLRIIFQVAPRANSWITNHINQYFIKEAIVRIVWPEMISIGQRIFHKKASKIPVGKCAFPSQYDPTIRSC